MKFQIALAAAMIALSPLAASAASQEEQNACMGDALGICGDFIPDHGRVAACLSRNINRISAPCRTVMLRYQKPTTAANVSKPAPAPASKAKATKGPLNIKPKVSQSTTGSRS
jgi:hypothetical protein